MKFNRIGEITSGNVIGVVEEPVPLDPKLPLSKQVMVKIGVIDKHGGLPDSDARFVIEKLRDFVSKFTD